MSVREGVWVAVRGGGNKKKKEQTPAPHRKLMVFTRKNPVAWKLQSHRGQRQTEHKQIDELSNKFVKTDQNFPCTFETSLIAVFCTRMV